MYKHIFAVLERYFFVLKKRQQQKTLTDALYYIFTMYLYVVVVYTYIIMYIM